MNLRWTLFLLLANGLVFGTLLFLEKPWIDPEDAAAASSRLIAVNTDEIDYLEIFGSATDSRRVMTRERDQWTLQEPVIWPANPFAVNRILNQIQFAERETSFSLADLQRSAIPLEEYGLLEPRLTLRIGWKDNRRDILIGAPTGMRNRLYVLDTETEMIHIVNHAFADAIHIGLDDLRSDSIFSLPVYEIQSFNLEVTEPNPSRLRLQRTGNQWLFEAPFQSRADRATTEGTLSQLVRLQVGRFYGLAPDDLEPYGLDQPHLRLVLEGPDSRQTLLVGKEADNLNDERTYYAKLRGRQTIFSLPARPLDDLRNARYVLRDRQILEISPETVTGLDVTGATDGWEIELRRLETGPWQVTSRRAGEDSQTAPADLEIINDAILQLSQLRARDFISDAPSSDELAEFGLNDPQRTLELHGNQSTTILIGDNTGSRAQNVYLRVAGEPFVYEVDAQFLRRMPLTPTFYRQRLMIDHPAGLTLTRINLQEIDSGISLFDFALPEDAAGDWETFIRDEEQSIPESAQDAILTLVAESRRFSVNHYYPFPYEEDGLELDGLIPWMYRLDVEFSAAGSEEGETRTQQLVFSENFGDALQHGGWEKENLTFSLRTSTRQALREIELWQESRQLETIPTIDPVPGEAPGSDEEEPVAEDETPATEESPETNHDTEPDPEEEIETGDTE